MGEFVNEKFDEFVGRHMIELLDGYVNERAHNIRDEQKMEIGWMREWMNKCRWLDGFIDRWMGENTYGQTGMCMGGQVGG